MNYKQLSGNISLLIISALMLHGCGIDRREPADKGIVEGSIIYNITYPDQLNNAMSFLFPSQMTLHFSNGHQRAVFKGNMNLYGLDFIHRNESDSFFTMLKILEKRIYVPSSETTNMFIFDNEINNQIVYDEDNVREIAGFQCRNARLVSNNPNQPVINIWYTNEIGIEDPNRNTPFDMIPGLMMEFQMMYENVVFHLIAQKVVEESHSDDFFQVPANYERTTLSEVEELIRTVFN